MFHDLLETRNACLDRKNKKLRNLERLGFLQRGLSMVFVKNLKLFHFLFLAKIGQGNVFHDLFTQKNVFLDLKNKKL